MYHSAVSGVPVLAAALGGRVPVFVGVTVLTVCKLCVGATRHQCNIEVLLWCSVPVLGAVYWCSVQCASSVDGISLCISHHEARGGLQPHAGHPACAYCGELHQQM